MGEDEELSRHRGAAAQPPAAGDDDEHNGCGWVGVGKDFSTSGRRPSPQPSSVDAATRCASKTVLRSMLGRVEWTDIGFVFVLQMLGHQSARNKELPKIDE